LTRATPDVVSALLLVTAVGLAFAVHSIGMLGRLFAETIEHTAWRRLTRLPSLGQSGAGVPAPPGVDGVASLARTRLYRLDEHPLVVRGTSLAPGKGFGRLTAANHFQYREVSLLLIVIFASNWWRSGCRPYVASVLREATLPAADRPIAMQPTKLPCLKQALVTSRTGIGLVAGWAWNGVWPRS